MLSVCSSEIIVYVLVCVKNLSPHYFTLKFEHCVRP